MNKPAAKFVLVVLALAICALLIVVIISNFITGTLIDERFGMDRNTFAAGANSFPNSTRLPARLAEIEVAEP